MRRRAFVRLGRLSVPAKYRKQRRKRQDDEDFAANAVDLLPTNDVTSSPACCRPLDSSYLHTMRCYAMLRYTHTFFCQALFCTKYRHQSENVMGIWCAATGPH